jgi:hypothetical protein
VNEATEALELASQHECDLVITDCRHAEKSAYAGALPHGFTVSKPVRCAFATPSKTFSGRISMRAAKNLNFRCQSCYFHLLYCCPIGANLSGIYTTTQFICIQSIHSFSNKIHYLSEMLPFRYSFARHACVFRFSSAPLRWTSHLP